MFDLLAPTDERFPIDGRWLHEKLGVTTRYNDWFARMVEYADLEEGKSYYSKLSNRSDGKPGKGSTTHLLAIDAAKEICILQRNEVGKQIRRQLIEIEEKWNSPEAVMSRALVMANRQLTETSEQVKLLKSSMDEMKHQNAALVSELKIAAPKADAYDDFMSGEGSILIGDLSKILQQHGAKAMTPMKLFEWLHRNGYLMRESKWVGGRYQNLRNVPTQRSLGNGWLIGEWHNVPDCPGMKSCTCRVTSKGIEYFVKKLCPDRNPLRTNLYQQTMDTLKLNDNNNQMID